MTQLDPIDAARILRGKLSPESAYILSSLSRMCWLSGWDYSPRPTEASWAAVENRATSVHKLHLSQGDGIKVPTTGYSFGCKGVAPEIANQ